MIKKTGERMLPSGFKCKEEYLIYLRHLFAYDFAKKMIPQNSIILEVGCGEGYGAKRLSKSNKIKKIVGLDVDKDSIEHASKKYINSKLFFKYYKGEKIPFKKNFFDVVISFQVIEHIENDNNYIKEIYRVLRKGGLFILTTPNRVYRLKPNQKPWNRFHIREYDSRGLSAILSTKFKKSKILGLKGNSEIQNIEIERVKKNQKLISLDLLNIRNLIPESFKLFLVKIYRKLFFEKKENNIFFSRYKISQHFLTSENIDDSLDLFAVCKK